MTREEIVTALRICSNAKTTCNGCPLDCPDDGLIVGTACFDIVPARAADLIENQQREIEALRQANEGLRYNMAAYVGGGVPDAPDGDCGKYKRAHEGACDGCRWRDK